MPAFVDAKAPHRAASARIDHDLLVERYEDGLCNYGNFPNSEALLVPVDLLGPLRLVPVAPGECVAEDHPSTFRLRLPVDGSRDRFEFDWGEVRSYARRAREAQAQESAAES
jgi:hypothetical protein